MTLTKIGSVALHLASRSALLKRISIDSKVLGAFHRPKGTLSKPLDEPDDIDRPIKFSDSGAAVFEPAIKGKREDDWPWIQPYSAMISTFVFLVYFCVLREENDIDKKLTKDFSENFTGERKKAILESQKLAEKFAAR